MYKFKIDKKELLKRLNISEMARVTGITRMYLYLIFNRDQRCSKVMAYSITKFISEDAEIQDYFNRA